MEPIDLGSLLLREDAHVEWKRGVADVEDIVRTLTAFANDLDGSGRGGWVICGIEEGKDEHGFPVPTRVGLAASRLQEIRGKALDWCRKRVSPPIFPIDDESTLPNHPARRILIFHVPASPYLHVFQHADGISRYWVRHGSKTVAAQGELLRQLQRSKGDLPPYLERTSPGTTVDDLDLLAARDFLGKADLPHPVEEYLKPENRLDAVSPPLVRAGSGRQPDPRGFPTYLAVLLFGREPTRWIPGAYAVFTVYEGVERTAPHSTRFQPDGSLPRLIRDILDRLELYTGISIDKSSNASEIKPNRPRYSMKALQEALVNAFAHRDYESREPVRVTVFSDRIEIASPGGLVPGLEHELVQRGETTPFWRNPALVGFLLRLQLAQNEGQGLKTIIKETQATAGREPQILPRQNVFEVVIPSFRPVPPVARADEPGAGGRQGLIFISIGGHSIRPTVEHSLPELSLEDAELLVDFFLPEYVHPEHWETEAARIRDQVRGLVEDPHFSRFHLFYRGPVAIAPLLGALIAPAKPLVVYHHEDGRYIPAYTLDRRFLLSRG